MRWTWGRLENRERSELNLGKSFLAIYRIFGLKHKYPQKPAAQCELTVKPDNYQQTARGRYSDCAIE